MKNTPKVTINLMDKADLLEILEIERECFPSPWTVGMFTKELESSHSVCLTARINIKGKSIIGAYIIFWLVADEVHLHNLAVKKEYRRQKIAYRLMEVMSEIAGKNDITVQTLEVRKSNIEAIKLYQKCGFVVEGIRPLYYADTHEDALIMWADVKK